MAWEHIKAAFDYSGDVGESALHLLLRIAFEMRGNDYAFPGTEYLANKMHCCRKTVNRDLRELQAAGAIQVKSGRFSGHRNHYYLTIPGLPPPNYQSRQGGTNRALSTMSRVQPVDNSPAEVGQKGLVPEGVGQIRPEGVGQIGQTIGQKGREGWDIPGAGERNYINKNQDKESQSQHAQNVPPHADTSVQQLPPAGTIEFKAFAIHFCYEAGASLDKAREFYERHQRDAWAVLEHMPLEVAARQFVDAWKKADIHAWYDEQFSRLSKSEVQQ